MNKPGSRQSQRELLEKSFVEISRLRSIVTSYKKAQEESIAIMGIGCRFPGNVTNPSSFWNMLSMSKDCTSDLSRCRGDIAAYYSAYQEAVGKSSASRGGILSEIDEFDPGFFGISPREAKVMDPQQRISLEVCWEALEDANINPQKLKKSKVGVYIGMCSDDYGRISTQNCDLAQIDSFLSLGNTRSIVAGRIAYFLGVNGPVMQIDTSCSSSLVCIHLAIESLRRSECDIAIVGGVNLLLSPETWVGLSNLKALSPNGRCKSFDVAADGYARGEGCGFIVLKRSSDVSSSNGDEIIAKIRGAAVNHDGHSNGLTAPHGPSQSSVIQAALNNAKVDSSAIQYVEAHGTGTSLGDPIEIGALDKVFGDSHTKAQPLLVGAVKTNIGHLEAASGIAGVIKAALSLQNKKIPASLHFSNPNPHISWDEIPIKVTSEQEPWPECEGPRMAGVSSFGFSGTNAHVILEEAPSISQEELPKEPDRPVHILPLSAKSPEALKSLVQRYQVLLSKQTAPALKDLCYSAATGRSHFRHRIAIVSRSMDELEGKLQTDWDDSLSSGVYRDEVLNTDRQKLAFLFTGQGSQYVDMGQELFESHPAFRATLEQCDEILQPYLEYSLLEVLYPSNSKGSLLDETGYTQPALFALEYALATLWQSWGIQPSVVMGHSVGEYVAACIAGVFSLEDGLKLIAIRGQLMQALPEEEGMVAILTDEERVITILEAYSDQLSIAAINGLKQIVVSGANDALEKVCLEFKAEGVAVKPLSVSHAFHSPLMQPILEDFARAAGEVTYSKPEIRIISNVSGELIGEEICTADYWVKHVSAPVCFSQGIASLHEQECCAHIEIGPKPALLTMGQQCIPESKARWLPSLREGQSDWQQLLNSIGDLYVGGVTFDWDRFDANYSRRSVTLPTYPFQRKRYWFETKKKVNARSLSESIDVEKSLLGCRLSSTAISDNHIIFESYLGEQKPSYLQDHRLYDLTLVPASAYIEMTLAAGAKVLTTNKILITGLKIETPLVLLEDQDFVIQIVFTPEGEQVYTFCIFSRSLQSEKDFDEEPLSWQRHASGKITEAGNIEPSIELADWRILCPEQVRTASFYQKHHQRGLNYGADFQAVKQIWRGEDQVLGEITLPKRLIADNDFKLHPVLLDACLQLLGAVQEDNDSKTTYIPVSIKQFCLWSWCTHSRIWAHAKVGYRGKVLSADIQITDVKGAIIAKIDGLELKQVSAEVLGLVMEEPVADYYEIRWEKQPRSTLILNKPEVAGSWLIFADQSNLGKKIAKLLMEQGEHCKLIVPDGENPLNDAEAFSLQTIDPANPQDYIELLHGYSNNYDVPLRGVVYLWILDLNTMPLRDSLMESHLLQCGPVLNLVQALSNFKDINTPHLWLATRGAKEVFDDNTVPLNFQQSSIWGLGRVIALELPQLRCVQMDLGFQENREEALAICAELLNSDKESQIAWRNQQNKRYIARLRRVQHSVNNEATKQPCLENWGLIASSPGNLESLICNEVPRQNLLDDEIEVQVQAVALNFKDVLHALGMLEHTPQDREDHPALLGLECAGVIITTGAEVTDFNVGDEVVVVAPGCFRNVLTTSVQHVEKKPKGLSYEQAAALPTVFLTAFHALYELADLKAGERVLIHAGAGGVGQAAIQLAQRVGAEIFTTASPKKWPHLKAQGIKHIMNSRTLEFADKVMELTEGYGVDVVLNSLGGEFVQKSIEIVAKEGRFVEIGKLNILSEKQVTKLRPDMDYFVFDLSEATEDKATGFRSILSQIFTWLDDGSLSPSPITTFSISERVKAFRYLSTAKNIGKVVVNLLPEEESRPLPDKQVALSINEKRSYLITGGLGTLGLRVAEWLVDRGARHLVLVGRSAPSSQAKKVIGQLKKIGSEVVTRKLDVSDFQACSILLSNFGSKLPALAGLIHAAGMLEDDILVQQDWSRFEEVMKPKVLGAWNLHQLTAEQSLDFFWCFSSMSSVLGSSGQGNYAAANSFMDTLMHHRHRLGFSGLSINWGPWDQTRMVLELGLAGQSHMSDQGIQLLSLDQGDKLFNQLLLTESAQVMVANINWVLLQQSLPSQLLPIFLEEFGNSNGAMQPKLAILMRLTQLPAGERRQFLMDHMRGHLASLLGFSSKNEVEPKQKLFDLGIDSLLAVEFGHRIQSSLGCDLPSTLLFDYPTLEDIVDHLHDDILSFDEENLVLDVPSSDDTEIDFDALSNLEIAALLEEELKQ